MSQVLFDTQFRGHWVDVMSGWDPPLGYYHLTIFNLDDDEGPPEVLWSGLDRLGFCRTLSKIQEALESLGITPPPEFFDIIDRKEGNISYRWDGTKWTVRNI